MNSSGNLSTSHNEAGSFLTGFSIGLLAGAVGYFLFASDDGRRLKEELAKEWESAKDKLLAEKVINDRQVSWSQWWRQWWGQLLEAGADQNLPIKSAKTKASKKKPFMKRRFRGIKK